jgi:hypothetical protein
VLNLANDLTQFEAGGYLLLAFAVVGLAVYFWYEYSPPGTSPINPTGNSVTDDVLCGVTFGLFGDNCQST